MSYYYKHDISFSTHSLQRIRQRLKLKTKDDFEVRDICIKLIEMSPSSFETEYDLYIHTGTKQIYFVINKAQKTCITCTEVSIEKQLNLISK